jgi:hypothetical protein
VAAGRDLGYSCPANRQSLTHDEMQNNQGDPEIRYLKLHEFGLDL